MKYYAGIGSRETPPDIVAKMREIGRVLAMHQWTLRSGGADGADVAFESGARSVKGNWEIWNPRAGEVQKQSWAIEEVAKYCHEFPFSRMKPFTQVLLMRNMYQILGFDGDAPVKFVICWTKTEDPCHKDAGGTRYAVRCAVAHGIPVFNLSRASDLEKVTQRIEALKG